MKKKLRSVLDNPKLRVAILYITELAAVILLGCMFGYGTAMGAVILDAIIRRLS